MIAAAHAAYPDLSIRQLCTAVGGSRTWWYTHPSADESAARDTALRDAIERLVLAFPGYGYRRVTKALHREGWVINHKRVLRVMREESLLCQLERRFVRTTDSAHALRTYPNLLADLVPAGPNQAWVADLTYIRLPTTFAYLAGVLDAWSRRCVGWELSRAIDTTLTLGALDQALATRQPAPGLIHHSDRGVQYASAAYITRLTDVGAQVSMSASGNPYDNAKAESFFKTLKREEVYLNTYQTFRDAEENLDRFIADVYNTKRLHSSLGYLPPMEFEENDETFSLRNKG
jgi:transposase InsO family protein